MTNLPMQKLLDTWKNKKVVVWGYTGSLGILVLRLFSVSEVTLLEITCINTTFFCGQLRWSECDMQIERINFENEYSPPFRYIIRDKQAKFEIQCSEIEIVERNSEQALN